MASRAQWQSWQSWRQATQRRPMLCRAAKECGRNTGAFAAPVIGHLLDKYHPRRVLLGGAFMVTMGYVATAYASSYLMLYAIFGLLFGAGWRAISSFATSRVLVQWFRRKRGLALSLDVAGASFAGVFVPVIAV